MPGDHPPAALHGRVAIVTGASGGIGSATCEALREAGASVLGVDVVSDSSDVFVADGASSEGVTTIIEEAHRRFGRIDTLVFNAGFQHLDPIETLAEEHWDSMFDVMVKGPFLATQQAWSDLTAQPGGRVVMTTSLASFIAEANKAPYTASKHAAAGLVKAIALEGASKGLTANAVAPGWVRTPMVESQIERQMELRGLSREELLAWMLSRQPGGRLVEPQEVASLIAFLAGGAAAAISGAIIPIDLGYLAG